jgi:hypothetical protein
MLFPYKKTLVYCNLGIDPYGHFWRRTCGLVQNNRRARGLASLGPTHSHVSSLSHISVCYNRESREIRCHLFYSSCNYPGQISYWLCSTTHSPGRDHVNSRSHIPSVLQRPLASSITATKKDYLVLISYKHTHPPSIGSLNMCSNPKPKTAQAQAQAQTHPSPLLPCCRSCLTPLINSSTAAATTPLSQQLPAPPTTLLLPLHAHQSLPSQHHHLHVPLPFHYRRGHLSHVRNQARKYQIMAGQGKRSR